MNGDGPGNGPGGGLGLVGPRGRGGRSQEGRSRQPPVPAGALGSFGGLVGGIGRAIFTNVLQGGLRVFIDFGGLGRGRRGPPPPPGALEQAVPIPAPQPQPPPTQRFPTGPAANDAVFRRVGIGAGRLLGIGGILIAGAEVLVAEVLRRQAEQIDEEEEERAREIAEINRRAAARRDAERVAAIATIPDRLPLPAPDRIGRPDVGVPDQPDAPIFPEPLPDVVITPTVPVPQFEPAVSPIPAPSPVVSPTPAAPPLSQPGIVVNPVSFPVVAPVPTPFLPFSVPLPQNIPIGDPLPLTGVGTGTVPSPTIGFAENPVPQLQLNPDRCPARKCEDDPDDPRGQCFKGLYREGAIDTDFTAWQEIDCVTGREI